MTGAPGSPAEIRRYIDDAALRRRISFSARPPGAYENARARITWRLVNAHIHKPRVRQHAPGQLLAEGSAQSCPALGKRDSHAVQRAGGVGHRCERVSD